LRRLVVASSFSVCLIEPDSFAEEKNSRKEKQNADVWTKLVSGGFAVVQPGSKLSINAVEGYALEDFSIEVCIHDFM